MKHATIFTILEITLRKGVEVLRLMVQRDEFVGIKDRCGIPHNIGTTGAISDVPDQATSKK